MLSCCHRPMCPTVEEKPGKLFNQWWLHTRSEDETKIKRNPSTVCHQLHATHDHCTVTVRHLDLGLQCCRLPPEYGERIHSSLLQYAMHSLNTTCDTFILTTCDTFILRTCDTFILTMCDTFILTMQIQCTLKAREQGSIQ